MTDTLVKEPLVHAISFTNGNTFELMATFFGWLLGPGKDTILRTAFFDRSNPDDVALLAFYEDKP